MLVSLEKNSMPTTPLKMSKHCRKCYSTQDIFEHGRTITAEDAIKDVQFLDKRHTIVQTYEHMLNQDGKNVLSEGMKIKFAENGMSSGILKDISTKLGKNGLFSVVVLPPSVHSSAKSQARIT